MSLLDGLKDSMKNPLAENNNDMEFVLESDFELALEKATDVKLSPEDIRAILNGDDDIDDEEDDLDNPGDDVDKDYTSELEACKEALEATITELGIDTAGDEICEDDDLDDPELDPEGEDEILSEEALLAEIESIGTSNSEEAALIAECESLIADMPEDEEPPADDSAMESPNPGADKNTKVKGITESDDDSDDDDEDESEEDEDSDKHKHHEEFEDDDDECEKKHHKHHDHDKDDEDESEDDDEKESDDDDEKKDKKEKEDDDDEDEEAEESTLESILDNLLGVPM